MNVNTPYEFNLEYTFTSDALADLNRKITLLMTTPVGSIPLDREFGIDWSFIDTPTETAKSLFTAEVVGKIQKFMPEIRIEAVDWIVDDSGNLIPKVVIANA